ncbi:MAG: hypothetical protein MJY45_05230 [Bacteroidales bacterium]|nr:hypothetical protein [Bacteroidales bacterium]
MKSVGKFLGIAVLMSSCAANSPYSDEEFRLPDIQWRPVPLWFWNNATVTGEQALVQLARMVDTDFYGGCAIVPFGKDFQPDYLSDEYFNIYGAVIDFAREKGAQMSIYDEYGFPSGSMGAINGNGVSRFADNHPGHTIKRLDKFEYGTRPSSALRIQLGSGGKRMATVAMDKNTGEVISLSECISDSGLLEWNTPAEGEWTVMDFLCVDSGDPNVDYLSSESVKLFVDDTHEQYYRRFGSDFGTVITSTFFDEPTLYRADGRIWTESFNDRFQKEYGLSPETLYPALWYSIGDGTTAARNMMFGTRARMYAEGFMKTIADWATEHRILSTGHQDQEEVLNTVSVSGDLMLDGKYMTMPGIDKIGGDRPAEHFYKVVSSSACNWDHDKVMSETFGAMGNISFDTMYRIAVEQYTKGINNLIPHAFWYNDDDVTFLPELSTRNPIYCDSLPDFNKFLSRLNYILARPGRHIADVALLYPIQTLQAGHHFDGELHWYLGGVTIPGTDYSTISRILTDELGTDFTYLHPEVIDGKCDIRDGRLVLTNEINTESYSVIILPGVSVISVGNMAKIHEAWKRGVRVIFTTTTPHKCADPDGSDDAICATVERMLHSENNPALFVAAPSAETVREALQDIRLDVAFNSGGELNCIHKVIGGKNVFLFGNIDSTPKASVITFAGNPGKCVWMDPHTGDVSPAVISRNSDRTYCTELTLAPSRGMFLISR